MQEYNVLILSAGRRVELIQAFKAASARLDIKSDIIAGDCQETAPALYFADKRVLLPKINDGNYIDEIIRICNNFEVSLVVPTIDTDLIILSENQERIEAKTKALVLISNEALIKICRDKYKTHEFLEQNHFLTPRLYTEEDLENGKIEFPAFIKPKSGSSSINAYKVENQLELDSYRKLILDPIVQSFIHGDEYTVDCFVDFNGNPITVVPRLRIATRGGEISKGKIVKDNEIIEDVIKLLKALNPIGHITIQLMKTEKGIVYIEINPRFGGGAPMSIYSGADSCENLYRILQGETLYYNEEYKENLLFLRYDQSICLDENMEMVDDKSCNI